MNHIRESRRRKSRKEKEIVTKRAQFHLARAQGPDHASSLVKHRKMITLLLLPAKLRSPRPGCDARLIYLAARKRTIHQDRAVRVQFIGVIRDHKRKEAEVCGSATCYRYVDVCIMDERRTQPTDDGLQ